MARLSLEEIAQELQLDGWKVLSTEYKNLDSEMEFMCPEGHHVFAPYKHIRAKKECPVCKTNMFKDPEKIIKPKVKGKTRILGLDQATHITGYAVFDGRELVTYGTFIAKEETEKGRLHEVNMWLVSQIKNWEPDYIGIEGIQYQQEIGVTTFQTLARLQGVLMETCTQAGVPYKICPTNTWRSHCNVKGKTRQDKKRSMQLIVKDWFDVSVSDDCADAIGIAKYVADTSGAQSEIINWE